MTVPTSVLVVGTGLLGTSIGLALRRQRVAVFLEDVDPGAAEVAESLGAGTRDRPDGPVELAVVAVPPAATGQVVVDVLESGRAGVVTDVASVKALPRDFVAGHSRHAARYVGGHPMAGREVSGPHGAAADLFEGRPWVVCPGPQTAEAPLALVCSVAELAGAIPVRMDALEHDAAVALVSHAPHLVASLVAGRLADAADSHVGLAGPGVTDVTRIAASDPGLWSEILTANAHAVADVLRALRADLDDALRALERNTGSPAADRDLREVLDRGVLGRGRLPGKHGAAPIRMVAVQVVVDDRPGQLARLFADAGQSGVNVEDVRIEHRFGQPTGAVELDVRLGQQHVLAAALRSSGWTVHD